MNETFFPFSFWKERKLAAAAFTMNSFIQFQSMVHLLSLCLSLVYVFCTLDFDWRACGPGDCLEEEYCPYIFIIYNIYLADFSLLYVFSFSVLRKMIPML